MRMRGRENARPEMWIRLLDGIIARLTDVGTITQTPRVDGKGITAQVDPGATKGRAVLKPTAPEPPEQRPPSGPQVTTRRMERPPEGAAPPAVDPARRPPPPSGAPAPARGPGPR